MIALAITLTSDEQTPTIIDQYDDLFWNDDLDYSGMQPEPLENGLNELIGVQNDDSSQSDKLDSYWSVVI